MAGGWQLGVGHSNFQTYGADTTATAGTAVLSSGANTKGAYVQMVSATAADCNGVVVWFDVSSIAGNGISIDLAYGGAGSEKVAVADIEMLASLQHIAVTPILPVAIKAGTRISLRSQSTAASDTPDCAVVCLEGAYNECMYGAGSDTIGFIASATMGTAVTTTTGSAGSYAQLTSSTVNDYRGFMIAFDNQKSTTSGTDTTFLMDIAIGGAGSEKIILPQFMVVGFNGGAGMYTPEYTPIIEYAIPAGSRIAIRGQRNGTITVMGAVFYGFR